MSGVPPHDLDVERAVLGCVMISPACLPGLLGDVGLQPAHFYLERHRLIFAAMRELADKDEPVDPVTVTARVERLGVDRAYVHALGEGVPFVGHHEKYGRTVRELYALRRQRRAGQLLIEGAEARDEEKLDEAQQLLAVPMEIEQRTSDPEQLAGELFDYLAAGPPETFRWPFPRFDKLTMGGMRRGQVTLIAGWPKMGKSVFLDQCLESAAAAGLKVHLFINEMAKLERTTRTVARLAVVPHETLLLNRLDDLQAKRVAKALERIPFGITDCSGWRAQDVARQVRRERYDLFALDIVNRLPRRGRDAREDLEEQARALDEVTKTAGCHALVAAHLNRNRAGKDVTLPFPSMADIRDTGMLAANADNVIFVHRDQDEDTGEPLPGGIVRLAAVRTGRPGGVPVSFEGQYMRFGSRIPEARPEPTQEQLIA